MLHLLGWGNIHRHGATEHVGAARAVGARIDHAASDGATEHAGAGRGGGARMDHAA